MTRLLPLPLLRVPLAPLGPVPSAPAHTDANPPSLLPLWPEILSLPSLAMDGFAQREGRGDWPWRTRHSTPVLFRHSPTMPMAHAVSWPESASGLVASLPVTCRVWVALLSRTGLPISHPRPLRRVKMRCLLTATKCTRQSSDVHSAQCRLVLDRVNFVVVREGHFESHHY